MNSILNTLIQEREWDAVRLRMHTHVEEIRDDKSISSLVTLESTPFDIYVTLTLLCTRSNGVFEPFDNAFILNHVDEYITITGPSMLLNEMFDRGPSASMDQAAFGILENYPELLYDSWTIGKALSLARGAREKSVAHRMFQIGIQRKIASVELVEHLDDAVHHQAIVDSLACYRDFYLTESLIPEATCRLCFAEFFRVLCEDFPLLLTYKHIVNGLHLMHSALGYRKEDIFHSILEHCPCILHCASIDDGQRSIFHEVAHAKAMSSMSKLLGLGASPEELHFYPDNHDILLQKDERGLSPLHYLWIMTPEPLNRRYRSHANRYNRDNSEETVAVERTLMCLRDCERKFPGISRHFVHAWTHVTTIASTTLGSDFVPFSLSTMRRIVHAIAQDENRPPLHVGCAYGMSWKTGLRVLYHERETLVEVPDSSYTGLMPFALAACGEESDLTSVYELLRLYPTALLHKDCKKGSEKSNHQ